MAPKHNRFEVEDINTRENFTFSLEGEYVVLYNTSRDSGNVLLDTMGPDKFPFDCKTAKEYYKYVLKKSTRPNDDAIYFIGYVDNNFQPIELE